MDLREKIAELLGADAIHGFEASANELADQTLTIFQDWLKEEVGKMEVLSDETIIGIFKECLYYQGSPIECKRRLAQAQLEHNKKSLLDKIEKME